MPRAGLTLTGSELTGANGPCVGLAGLCEGHGMAKNIAKAGYDLRFTLRSDSDRVDDLIELGAQRVDDHAALGRECDDCVNRALVLKMFVKDLLENRIDFAEPLPVEYLTGKCQRKERFDA